LAARRPFGHSSRARRKPMPVVGFLNLGSPSPNVLARFHQGLGDVGFVEGRNVAIEYRFADNEAGRLPEFAAELCAPSGGRHHAPGFQAILAAKPRPRRSRSSSPPAATRCRPAWSRA